MPEQRDDLWVPDNADGSGWADVDWVSTTQGSRYHYQHGEEIETARTSLPPLFRVVTRLESETIRPHENTYYVPSAMLHGFVEELVWNGGAERLWSIEPTDDAPPEAKIESRET